MLKDLERNSDYPIQPLVFTRVNVDDSFWWPRIKNNREVTIPYCFDKCETTGRIRNFEKAAGLVENDGKVHGCCFDDSDVYKILEGAGYALGVERDPELEAYCDRIIDTIAAAQEEDGYLYTARTINPENPHKWSGKVRWEKEAELGHELYCLGHLIEGAVAYYQATGKRKLLDVSIRFADLVDKDFGPGRNTTAPGHQGVELALVRLALVTGEDRYLKLARFFLDTRGPGGGEYSQAHEKVVDQRTAVGHAVRATYMYAGMADVAAITGDKSYLDAIEAIWEDVAQKKLYITGGIGARRSGEAFGDAYELPNMSAYCETCAAIANVFWNHRHFLLHGDAKYIDVLERTLYNGYLSGIALSGKEFFYPNPLMSMGQHERSPWFGCSCCPSNVARFMPSIPGYVYAQRDNDIYVNLYMAGDAELDIPAGKVILQQQGDYPWQGNIDIAVQPESDAEFSIRLRIPGWARNEVVPSTLYRYADEADTTPLLKVNGEDTSIDLDKGYVVLKRTWKAGDKISLNLPMPVRRVLADDRVEDDRGMAAYERGPLVYCLEWPDQEDGKVLNHIIPDETALETKDRPDLLNGVRVLQGQGRAARRSDEGAEIIEWEASVTAIPYYAWAHRGTGEMAVWIARDTAHVRPTPRKTIASTSKITVSGDKGPTLALHDQLEPRNSHDNSMPYIHWWPNAGTEEWVEYQFEKPATVGGARVYWYDDGPFGGCRIPESWRILIRHNGDWKEVEILSGYEIAKDRFNDVRFQPVETDAMRLEVKFQENVSGGLLEWEVLTDV